MDGAYIALRGYKFQFDRTILEIFQNAGSTIELEQLQDYGYDDYLVQVKYHDTDYNAPQQKQKIKKPLLLLFEQFLANKKKRFVLYIYLKNVSPSKKTLTITELDSILGRTTKYSVVDKQVFIKKFTLIYAEDFEKQYRDVIQRIRDNYSKTSEEAELYYSIISSHLLEIVTKNSPANNQNRTSSKAEIDALISSGKKIIFHSTYLDTLNKEKQLKYLHNTFFKTGINTESLERFFIIEAENANTHNLKEVTLKIKEKWSRNKTKTIPDSDRFVPYLFFRGINHEQLVKLKIELQRDGHKIIDGYDFANAPFNLQSISGRPTFENKIFFKFINQKEDLDLTIQSLSRTAEVYQFFKNEPIALDFDGKHIKIEFEEIADIKHII